MNKLPTRLIIDAPSEGAWNMAIDEALLESAINDGVATLRFYQWSEPTLSLGYFQKLADRKQHAASRECPVVRRHSGGGAILHDRELTYSLALPPDSPLVREAEQVYRLAHQALLATMTELAPQAGSRLSANLCSAAIPDPGGAEPFLCFRRRARCDVLIPCDTSESTATDTIDGRHKVCGSAQRKKRGAVLQHGSLLLERSAAAPELPGVGDLLAPIERDAARWANPWSQQLATKLGLELEPVELTDAELSRAEELATQQFRADAWIGRR